MKRRLVIARGLINKPQILILDEPTTGLDPQARHLIWNKLRNLKRAGSPWCLPPIIWRKRPSSAIVW